MIPSRLLRLLPWSVALASGAASAVGLGEINLYSRIGEALRAEIPVLSAGEPLDAACFSLAPIPGADLPVVTAGRTRFVRGDRGYRLIITGSAPIDEAVFMINVRAGCGFDTQREYTLLPIPPESHAASDGELPLAVAEPAPRKTRPVRETWSPDSEAPITTAAKPRPPRPARSAAAKAKAPLPRDTLARMTTGKDRIVLGAALDDLPPPGAGDPLAPVNALDERILKLETTLHLLNEEVDKLNSALALNAESRAMRQKLQDLEAAPPGVVPGALAAPLQVPADAGSSHDGWLELLFGLLLGGSVSAGVAHLVSRRQDKARAFAPPPRVAKPGKRRRPATA